MVVPEHAVRTWMLAAAAAALLSPWSPAEAQDVFRWVDDNGEVHYGVTLPPEQANRPYQILRNGLVVKSVDDPTAPELTPQQLAAEKNKEDPAKASREKQMKADRLLVLKYRSEEEILDAMQVEVDNLAYDARLIEQGRVSVLTSLKGQVREAADRQRAGLPVDAAVNKEIAQMRARLRQGEKSRASLDLREQQIRQLFESELARYRYLMEGGAEGEPIPTDAGGDDNS